MFAKIILVCLLNDKFLMNLINMKISMTLHSGEQNAYLRRPFCDVTREELTLRPRLAFWGSRNIHFSFVYYEFVQSFMGLKTSQGYSVNIELSPDI